MRILRKNKLNISVHLYTGHWPIIIIEIERYSITSSEKTRVLIYRILLGILLKKSLTDQH